ncbi:MAG: DUF4835 family protein [Ignavibacterium sp.]
MKKFFLIIFLLSKILFSQELEATVTVNYENLPAAFRDYLIGFSNTIQSYLNNTRFSESNWENPRIKCSFNIFFTGAADEMNYTAQVFITSQREIYKSNQYSPMLKILDNNFSFTYQKNQIVYFDPSTFNSLASFFDYYAYLIIGFDNDSWEKLSGTEFFNNAFQVVNLSQSAGSIKGWDRKTGSYNRYDFVDNLLDEKFRPFREAIYDYYYGIDVYQFNKIIGQDKIAEFVKSLDKLRSKIDINSILIKVFFDTKNEEIVNYMKDYPDKNVLKILRAVDPSHATKYDEYILD